MLGWLNIEGESDRLRGPPPAIIVVERGYRGAGANEGSDRDVGRLITAWCEARSSRRRHFLSNFPFNARAPRRVCMWSRAMWHESLAPVRLRHAGRAYRTGEPHLKAAPDLRQPGQGIGRQTKRSPVNIIGTPQAAESGRRCLPPLSRVPILPACSSSPGPRPPRSAPSTSGVVSWQPRSSCAGCSLP
jgi:hypothetical protein